MKNILVLIISVLCLITFSVAQSRVNKKFVKSNLEFLASDELEGREAATRGEKIASLFIAKEFQKYGVAPYGDEGTFYQKFYLDAIKVHPSSKIEVGNISLKIKEDFAIFDKKANDIVTSGKLVYVGYGITSEKYNYDSYKNVDVKNKTVIVMFGEPYSKDNNYFNGTNESEYANMGYKMKNAFEHGANQILFLPASVEMQNMYWYYFSRETLKESLVASNDQDNSRSLIAISFDSLEKILKDEKIEYQEFKEYLKEKSVPESFELKKEINFDIKVKYRRKTLRNVVGVIEGTDPNLKDQYVTVTAHYDHVGFSNDDEVYNGADDNGSGTVAAMEVARLISQSPLKRSVIVSLFTAEEKGLFGSKFFTDEHPSLKNTMANVNLDMVARGSTDTLYSIGESKLSSELRKITEEVNEEMTNYVLDFSESNGRLFNNSDHWHFHNNGIPCVFLNDMDFTDLHRTSDDPEKINWEKLYKSIELTYRLVRKLGNLDHQLKLDKNRVTTKR